MVPICVFGSNYMNYRARAEEKAVVVLSCERRPRAFKNRYE